MAIRVWKYNIDIERMRPLTQGAAGSASNMTGAQELELKLQQLGSRATGVLNYTAAPANTETITLKDGDSVPAGGYILEYDTLRRAENGRPLPSGNFAIDISADPTSLHHALEQTVKAINAIPVKISAKIYTEQDTSGATGATNGVIQLIHHIPGVIGNQALAEASAVITAVGMTDGGNAPTVANTISAQFLGTEGTSFVIVWDDSAAAKRPPASEATAFPP